MARRRRSKYTAVGEDALAEIEAYQRSWVVIPMVEHHEEEGLVVLKAPKFQHRVGRRLVRLMKKDQEFNLYLDEFGSRAWHLYDGKRTVGQIADKMVEGTDDEPNLALIRLIMHLRSLKSGGLVRVVTIEKAEGTIK
jgi:hypothetical protein